MHKCLFSFTLVLALAAGGNAPAQQRGPGLQFDVRSFGATGGGDVKDTAAFQKALDACAAAGGGGVDVAAGKYLIGSVVIG